MIKLVHLFVLPIITVVSYSAIKNIPQKDVAVVNNSVKPDYKPKLINAESVRLDTLSDITYIKKGTIQIGSERLTADEIAWDKRNETLTAKTATLKFANLKTVSDQYIIYDLKKRTYITTKTPGNKIVSNSAAYQLLSALPLRGDSITVSRTLDRTLLLTGKVNLGVDGYFIRAKGISAQNQSNILSAYFAVLYTKDNQVIKADHIDFDVISKEYKIINK